MTHQPTIALFPEASFGAALNCVGIAQSLRERGARPVFICHAGFRGVFSDHGFREYHLEDGNSNLNSTQDDYWESFIARHLSSFRKNPYEQIEDYVVPTWEAIVNTVIDAEESLRRIISQIQPDVVLLDNVIMFPAIESSGVPWVRAVSCAETEIPDNLVPPYLSGCKVGDSECADNFSTAYYDAVTPIHSRYNRFREKCGQRNYTCPEFLASSPYLNLLLSPSSVRLDREIPLDPETHVYLEGCVRSEPPFTIPAFPKYNNAALVYVSFGSLGALDLDLSRKLIEVFSSLPYRFLVNVGPNVSSFGIVPDNVFLGSWFPQPSVVSKSDLFIHHGGNNSLCEALYFGVPSLVMPYCWDGHDNATRVVERNLGDMLHRYHWNESELQQKIIALIENTKLQQNLKQVSKDMIGSRGKEVAANSIFRLLT